MKKRHLRLFFKIFAIISVLIMLLFLLNIYRLNLIPIKYFMIILGIILVIYSILTYLSFKRRIKLIYKLIVCLIFLIINVSLFFGIKYVGNTSDFLKSIVKDLEQTEEYQVATLLDSEIKNIEELKHKKVGAYIISDTSNTKVASDMLKEKVNYELVEFPDIADLYKSLENKDIEAIIYNESVRNVANELEEINNVKIKDIYSIKVPIKSSKVTTQVDVTKKKFNIYIAGGDATGTINKVMNTDVNMVVSVDPIKKKLLLTSIPRDYYVNLVGQGPNAYDKLTHAGYYGIEESIVTVENLLDLDINYYAKINFSTVIGFVDAIEGIDVESDFNFCTNDYGTIYCYKKGINHLNGKYALNFARERQSFKDGDVQRVKNQQRVISAMINKVTSSTKIITNYSDILDSISSNFATNLTQTDISKLIKMQLNDMSKWTIESQNLVGHDAHEKTYTFPNMELYVMKQNEESVNEITNRIKEFMK